MLLPTATTTVSEVLQVSSPVDDIRDVKSPRRRSSSTALWTCIAECSQAAAQGMITTDDGAMYISAVSVEMRQLVARDAKVNEQGDRPPFKAVNADF